MATEDADISQFQVALHREFPILHHIMIKLYQHYWSLFFEAVGLFEGGGEGGVFERDLFTIFKIM